MNVYEQLMSDFCEKKYTMEELLNIAHEHRVPMSRHELETLSEATGDPAKIEGLDLMNFFEEWQAILLPNNNTNDNPRD